MQHDGNFVDRRKRSCVLVHVVLRADAVLSYEVQTQERSFLSTRRELLASFGRHCASRPPNRWSLAAGARSHWCERRATVPTSKHGTSCQSNGLAKLPVLFYFPLPLLLCPYHCVGRPKGGNSYSATFPLHRYTPLHLFLRRQLNGTPCRPQFPI